MGYENGGCDCCNSQLSHELGAKQWGFNCHYYLVGDGKFIYVKPKYCPMCGRKLEEESKNDYV